MGSVARPRGRCVPSDYRSRRTIEAQLRSPSSPALSGDGRAPAPDKVSPVVRRLVVAPAHKPRLKHIRKLLSNP